MSGVYAWFLDIDVAYIRKVLEMELVSEDIIVAVIAARNNNEIGIGAGPLLANVVKHYTDEKIYRQLRKSEDPAMQVRLDNALLHYSQAMHIDTRLFKVPSISGSTEMFNIMLFDFVESDYIKIGIGQ